MRNTGRFMVVMLGILLVTGCLPANIEVVEPTAAVVDLTPTDTPEPTAAPSPTATAQQIEAVSDADGNTYSALIIGEQTWLGENLRTVTGPNGRAIESYCYYDLEENCAVYGRLYDWKAAMAGSAKASAQGICPDGWHIPSDDEWMALIDFLGGEGTAGGKLKAAGTDHWLSPNSGASDEMGFGALPSGWFDFTGEFYGLGETGFYRTSSSDGPYEIFVRELNSKSTDITVGGLHPDDAIPVRCVKD